MTKKRRFLLPWEAICVHFREGEQIARQDGMADDDPRLHRWCTLGLASAALLHWVGVAIMLWQSHARAIQDTVSSNLG
jgi:hypothetical protein